MNYTETEQRSMGKGRIEAFSDGVIAIIITIMVLELKVPHSVQLESLQPMLPVFLCYVLSFIFIGIYWNNHHHLFQVVQKVSGAALWANLHLLFWLSLVPFVTGWMGENAFAPMTVALYGVDMLMAGIAYFILCRVLIAHHGNDSPLALALGKDYKGVVSTVIYVVAIPLAFVNAWISVGLFIIVAAMWLVPDRRIEAVITK